MASSESDPSEIRPLFLKVLDLPADQQAEILNRPEVSPAVREEVLAMLREDQGAETFLANTVENARPVDSGIGQRFGAFETRELLGRGGMGVVFLAGRWDGELAQTVAIKVIERGWLAPRAVERFRQERQFLAGLTHPGIARLIDGGTRADGVPYLVMEYVEGEPIDRYCDRLRLGLRDRLRLFLPLCDAVDYAHGKLIVHRDLKPSNILVTAGGAAKLLDFGVAKTLEAGDGNQTQTLMFTPDFASPEQARGEDATTATDIYGLGAVLYLLLTGQPPHATAGLSPAASQRVICEQVPERPALLNPKLKGDLENILLSALHPNPQRRYRFARDLAQDIQNYLADRPVQATPDRWTYRAGRFLRRHAAASIAAALALAAILGGTTFSLYEARQAQRRASQVRTLANRFIFDFEDAIINTPGTLAAQKMVVATAREYLANLAADARRDSGLSRDLAQSYFRLSGVEKRLGDTGASMAHLKTSLSILESLGDDCCGPAKQRKLYIEDLNELAWRLGDTGAVKDSSVVSGRAVAAGRRWTTSAPAEPLARKALLDALIGQGHTFEGEGRHPEAKQSLEEAVSLADAIHHERAKDPIAIEDAAAARRELALTLVQMGDLGAALEVVRAAEVTMNGLVAGAAANNDWQRSLVELASLRSRILNGLAKGDPALQAQALEAQREAYTMARASAAANPRDLNLLDLAATMTARLANRLMNLERFDESLALQRENGSLIDQMLAVEPDNRRSLYLRANSRLIAGYNLGNLKRWRESREVLIQGEQDSQRALAKDPNDIRVLQTHNGILMFLARAERNLGNLELARQRCREAVASAGVLILRNKQAKEPVAMIQVLHSEAKLLGVLDTTLPAR